MGDAMLKEMKINSLPAPTWNWLRLNYVNVTMPEEADDFLTSTEEADGVEIMRFTVGDKDYVSNREVAVEDGKNATFIMNYTSENQVSAGIFNKASDAKEAKVNASDDGRQEDIYKKGAVTKINATGNITFNVGKGATLSLVQVFMVSNDANLANNVVINADDKAKVKVIQLFLGGRKTFSELVINLNNKADADVKNAYYVQDKNLLDINYVANHIGKKSTSNMEIKGVLRDNAEKIFRGTIDLRNQGKGAEGKEHEDVLMLDPGVINKTIPLILCTEEDVFGSHGATIGRLDEELM
ncbi:MAG: SufD family Fe-S cluster assembly protein, partial [Lachnospiraceae bacterium]|nr:SufD family Fe-S cluster assembly protein [Lachnospiraceae bacterium]